MLDRVLFRVSKYLDTGIGTHRARLDIRDDVEDVSGMFVDAFIEFLGKKHHHEKVRTVKSSSEDMKGTFPVTWFDHLKSDLLRRWPGLRRVIRTVNCREIIHTTNVTTNVKIFHDITNLCPHLQYSEPGRPDWERGSQPACISYTQLDYDATRALQQHKEKLEQEYERLKMELQDRAPWFTAHSGRIP